MAWPAIVGGVLGLVGGLISGKSAEDAAEIQADAISDAARMTREAADEARSEILDRYVPALGEYRAGIMDAQNQIANGTADVMSILSQTTANADMMLAQTGIDAERAIMGSTASSTGMSMQDFNNQYQAIQAQPPTARREMTNQFQRALQQESARQTGSQPDRTGLPEPSDYSRPDQLPPVLAQSTGGRVSTLGGTAATPGRMTTQGQFQVGLPGISTGGRTTTPTAGTKLPGVGGISTDTGRVGVMPVSPPQIIRESPTLTTQAPVSTPAMSTEGIGFSGAMGNLQTGYNTAQAALNAATAQARDDVTGQTGQALAQLAETREAGLGRYQPYSEAGQAAVAREAALSGAYGPEAQQEAINAFIESPGQQYLRERQEQALLRNQAAIGGLGGGNVRTALQEQAMGIAATQQQQYLENLRSLATRGQEIAGAESGLIASTGMMGAQMTQRSGEVLSQLAQQFGISSANLAQMSHSEMAALAERTGLQVADIRRAVGAARAGLQTELGSGLAGAVGAGTSDLARLIESGALTGLTTEQNIASLLGGLATGTAANLADLQTQQGSALATGQYLQGQSWGQALQGLGQMASNYQSNNTGNTTVTPTGYGGQSTNTNVTDMSHLY